MFFGLEYENMSLSLVTITGYGVWEKTHENQHFSFVQITGFFSWSLLKKIRR